jgi:hypothetical protein
MVSRHRGRSPWATVITLQFQNTVIPGAMHQSELGAGQERESSQHFRSGPPDRIQSKRSLGESLRARSMHRCMR